jgi:hypothetical protein
MTEQMFPMGGTAVAEAPVAPVIGGFEDAGEGDNRRKLAVVGAIVGVLVLLIAAFFLLKGGSSPAPAAAAVPAGHSPAGSKPQATHGHKAVTLPKAFKGHVGRDPFKALYAAPVAAEAKTPKVSDPGTGTGSTDPGTGTTTGTGTGTTPSVPAPTTGNTGGTDTGSAPAKSFTAVWVELVSVKGTKTASFVVGYSNGKRSKTAAFSNIAAPTKNLRTAFAGTFALLSIQDGTATVQYGDSTPFDLAPGFGNRHFLG